MTIIDGPVRADLLAHVLVGEAQFAELTVNERRLAHVILDHATRRRAKELEFGDDDVRRKGGTIAVLDPDTGQLQLLHADGTIEVVEVDP